MREKEASKQANIYRLEWTGMFHDGGFSGDASPLLFAQIFVNESSCQIPLN